MDKRASERKFSFYEAILIGVVVATFCFLILFAKTYLFKTSKISQQQQCPNYIDDGYKCRYFPSPSFFRNLRRKSPHPSSPIEPEESDVPAMFGEINVKITKLSDQMSNFLLTQTNIQKLEQLKKQLEETLEQKVRILNQKENELNHLYNTKQTQLSNLETCKNEKNRLFNRVRELTKCKTLRKNHQKLQEDWDRMKKELDSLKVGLVVLIEDSVFYKFLIVVITISQFVVTLVYLVGLYSYIIGEYDHLEEEGDYEHSNELSEFFSILMRGSHRVTKLLVSLVTFVLLVMFVYTFVL